MYMYMYMYIYSGLIISKYLVSPIFYRRYFFSIGEGIVYTFEKSISKGIANIFFGKKINTFY